MSTTSFILPRRRLAEFLVGVAALLTALVLSAVLVGCSSSDGGDGADVTGSSGERVFAEAEDGAFPVTIGHAYGETTIEKQAERLVVVGWAGADLAVQLGTVPVAQGPAGGEGDSAEFHPWFREAVEELGAPLPATEPSLERGEVDTEFVATQEPDLILAISSGITAEEYQRLSDIAPTVAFPDEPWGTSAEDHLTMVGQALGRPSEAEAVTRDLDDHFAETAEAHPELSGVSFFYGFLPDDGQVVIFSEADPRVKSLEKLGMVPSPDLDPLAREADGVSSFNVAVERLISTDADTYVTTTSQEEWDAALATDRSFAAWGPVGSGNATVISDSDVGLALATSTPLSLAWAVDDIAGAVSDSLA